MQKKEIIREIRDVMSGNSGHTWIIVRHDSKSWEIAGSGIGNFSKDNLEKGDMFFEHVCNDMTLKEAEEELNKQEIEAEYR